MGLARQCRQVAVLFACCVAGSAFRVAADVKISDVNILLPLVKTRSQNQAQDADAAQGGGDESYVLGNESNGVSIK